MLPSGPARVRQASMKRHVAGGAGGLDGQSQTVALEYPGDAMYGSGKGARRARCTSRENASLAGVGCACTDGRVTRFARRQCSPNTIREMVIVVLGRRGRGPLQPSLYPGRLGQGKPEPRAEARKRTRATAPDGSAPALGGQSACVLVRSRSAESEFPDESAGAATFPATLQHVGVAAGRGRPCRRWRRPPHRVGPAAARPHPALARAIRQSAQQLTRCEGALGALGSRSGHALARLQNLSFDTSSCTRREGSGGNGLGAVRMHHGAAAGQLPARPVILFSALSSAP